MTINDMRRDLEAIHASAKAGDLDGVVQTVDRALQALDESRLLTTTEAADLLGIRSVNTLKLLVRRLGIPYTRHGSRMMLRLSDVERLQHRIEVEGIRASDRAHDTSGSMRSDALSQEELDVLSQARPGVLPWQQVN
ncbi:MAG TPA: helix-turn-helix domain-containing protein [Ktedonobacterales bacterium]|nr:helix-turn-helix domain-containing protein [Ktedonobacterales bacterium]